MPARPLSMLLLLILLVPPCSCSLTGERTAAPEYELAGRVAELLRSEGYLTAHMGMVLLDPETGKDLYALNAGKAFLPASNLKLFTAALALARLDPGWQAVTELHLGGPVKGGVLEGDLILRGGGDPTLGRGDEPLALFRRWGDRLYQRGIRVVAGRIVVDDALFGPDRLGRGWAWDDAAHAYGAPVGALVLHENVVRLTLTPRAAGLPAELSQLPTGLAVENRVFARRRGERRLELRRRWRRPGVVVTGSLPLDRGAAVLQVPVDEPSLFCGRALKRALEASGIEVRREVARIGTLLEYIYKRNEQSLAAFHRSPPLADMLKEMLHRSQNLYAENLFRLAGAAGAGEGEKATARRAAAAMVELLRELGVDTRGFAMHDGSGLSRMNQVTPRQAAGLLAAAWSTPWGRQLYALLPRAGREGTLARRFRGTAAAGRLRAKTGTLSRVSSLSGYLPRGPERPPLVFACFLQGYTRPVAALREELDRVLAGLAESLER